MEYKDYYQTLGVARDASADEIKKAYRKLVRKYHPDVSKHKNAEAQTKEINEAYEVLGNAEKRAAYDDLGRSYHAGEAFRPPPDWGPQHAYSDAGAEDLFADLFAHVGRGRRGAGFGVGGEDIHAAITIDLADAYHGAHRTISLRLPSAALRGAPQSQDKTLTVTIPKGVIAGQRLRLAGQGHAGHGGAAGTLYLEVEFMQDGRYQIDGADVYQHVKVAPWELALGARVTLATPGGNLEVTLPPGSQSGRKLRLKGRGIPARQPGDLYLILEVVLPPADSEKARALYQTMAREFGFNPRAA